MHAFGSAAECLLILAELQGIIFLVFRKLLRTTVQRETEVAHYLIDSPIRTTSIILIKQLSRRKCRLLLLVGMESEMASFSKFAAVWY